LNVSGTFFEAEGFEKRCSNAGVNGVAIGVMLIPKVFGKPAWVRIDPRN
jgi:hypothetical protein